MIMDVMKRAGLGLVVALVLAACGVESDTGADTTIPQPEVAETSNVPDTTIQETVVDSTLGSTQDEDPLTAAIKDLSRRLQVTAEDVEVVKAEGGYWNDLSVGCPEDGVAYAQMVVQGYRFELQVDGTIYVYHQGGTEPVFLCQIPAGDGFLPDKTVPQPSVPPPRE